MDKIKSADELPDIMTAKHIQNFLNVSHVTVYQMIHSAGFPVICVGQRNYRIPKEAFLEWLSSQARAYDPSSFQ